MRRKARLIGGTFLLYLFTIGTIGYSLQPSRLLSTPVHAESNKPAKTIPVPPRFVLVSGLPVRITVPDYGIDLAIQNGTYNADGSWTLSETAAQFATLSVPANNAAGNTFVYGHGTDAVFGKLGATTPLPETIAHIYTDTNQRFTYRFQETRNLTAADTWIFDDVITGPPRLTIQTCTGSFSEWRTMFTFVFEKVETI